MNLKKTIIIKSKKIIILLYVLIAIITGFKQFHKDSYNNYKIFKYTYYHSVSQTSLYKEYPLEYQDTNHYGPLFSLIIAPFAVLPDQFGTILWNIANALLLCWGIYSLPLKRNLNSLIALICAHEALGAMLSFQFNVGLTGLILLSFSYTLKQENIKSSIAIALGFLIKLYGIVGLAFFFFNKKKISFILTGAATLVVFLVLPVVISSPKFVYQSYIEWFNSLSDKNSLNVSLNSMQDISLMGMVHRIGKNPSIPNYPFILSGILVFLLPYVRTQQYQYLGYRLMLLASTLIFVVIFSSSSESPTYIIAFTGVAIWFMIQPKPISKRVVALFIFAFILTTLSPSDLFPKFIREQYVWKYSLKALPCVLIWVVIIYQMLTIDFKNFNLKMNE